METKLLHLKNCPAYSVRLVKVDTVKYGTMYRVIVYDILSNHDCEDIEQFSSYDAAYECYNSY